MYDLKKEDDEIIEKIRKIKQGNCPHLFITGASISAMEKLALKAAETFKEKRLISYKGIVKYFTINMPYFDDCEKVQKFMSHLKNSVSIARDCYAVYCGSILVEMSEEWSKKGYNPMLNTFIDYIQENSNLHFIIILPQVNKNSEYETIFVEFTRCGIWLKVNSQTPTPHQCVSYFRKIACSYGYTVSDEARQLLLKNLKERDEMNVENIKIVDQLIKQIVFNKTFEKNIDKVIDTDDMAFIASMDKKKIIEERKIGFVSYSR